MKNSKDALVLTLEGFGADFARELIRRGYTVYSHGLTFEYLRSRGIPAQSFIEFLAHTDQIAGTELSVAYISLHIINEPAKHPLSEIALNYAHIFEKVLADPDGIVLSREDHEKPTLQLLDMRDRVTSNIIIDCIEARRLKNIAEVDLRTYEEACASKRWKRKNDASLDFFDALSHQGQCM